jgi:hypothetical protein
MNLFFKRLLFILLILPLGIPMVFEIAIRLIISIFIWFINGNFNEDFVIDAFIYKIFEFIFF